LSFDDGTEAEWPVEPAVCSWVSQGPEAHQSRWVLGTIEKVKNPGMSVLTSILNFLSAAVEMIHQQNSLPTSLSLAFGESF
jgi:hypothetical protein